MRKFISSALLLVTALCLHAPVLAQEGLPRASVAIDGERQTIPVNFDLGLNLYLLNGGQPFLFTSADGLKSITVNASSDPDPFILYSANATNVSGATSNFVFDFASFVTDCPNGGTITHTMSGSLTTATPDGVTISLGGEPAIARADVNGIFNSALDLDPVGQTSGPGPGTFPYPPSGIFSATTSVTGSVTSLSARLDFNLSGTNDAAAITGQVNLVCVPEPGSVALMGVTAAFGVSLVARRRRR